MANIPTCIYTCIYTYVLYTYSPTNCTTYNSNLNFGTNVYFPISIKRKMQYETNQTTNKKVILKFRLNCVSSYELDIVSIE